MYFLTYIDRVNISTVVASNQFLKEIPLTKVQTGFVFSAFAYPYLLFQVIGGWVATNSARVKRWPSAALSGPAPPSPPAWYTA